MTAVLRGVAWAAAIFVTAHASTARADDAIDRRVAALRTLVARPHRVELPAARAAPAAPATAASFCGRSGRARDRDGDALRTRLAIRDASIRFSTDSRLIRSVIRHESAYDPNAVSHKGAMGLMQLMPGTATAMGVLCPFDPRENVLGGTRYLRRMYDRFGSWPRALAAYNAGPARVESGHIPAETRLYVSRILSSWRPGAIFSPSLP